MKRSALGWVTGRFHLIPRVVVATLGLAAMVICGSCSKPAKIERVSRLARISRSPDSPSASHRSQSQPNIIFINLDDADREGIEIDLADPSQTPRFPNITRLAREGMRFTNCHAAVPICGPSRVCLLTGQYASRTGIRCNNPGSRFSRGVDGGYLPYRDGGPFGATDVVPYRNNDLAVWMKNAGYHTMMVGKYLHHDYGPMAGETWADIIPGGWDDRYISLGGRYFDVFMEQNGSFSSTAALPRDKYPVDYRTEVESIDAQSLIASRKDDSKPFFLYLAPFAPHIEDLDQSCLDENLPNRGMVAPRYKADWTEIAQTITPDFNEADMSDKSETMQQLELFEARVEDPAKCDLDRLAKEYRRRMLSLRSIDDMVGNILAQLEQLDMIGNTIVILTSDNGFHIGHQRHFGKTLPYNRCTNIPLFVWGPGYVPAISEPQSHLISQVDFAPTLLDLAGADRPENMELDGYSFLPLLAGQWRQSPDLWRPDGILVEHWERNSYGPFNLESSFQELRMHNSAYIEWATGESEFYDLELDPFQLENGYELLTAQRQQLLSKQLKAVKPVMPSPVCFAENPFSGIDVFYRQVRLRGLAEYSGGVSGVRLVISDISNAEAIRFWNGTGWQVERIQVEAELTASGRALTDWSYEFAPNSPVDARYRVTFLAVGSDRSVSQQGAYKDFSIDPEMPWATFVEPLVDRPMKYGIPMKISGKSFDDAGIREVRLTIFDPKQKRFWNGEQWQDQRTVVIARNNYTTTSEVGWSCNFSPPETEGAVSVTAQSVNYEGQVDTARRFLQFSWAE